MDTHASADIDYATTPDVRRSVLAGAMLGVALMAAVDEIVFHQLLGWHHFYDRATPGIALFSDGLLHSVELVLLVGGFFLYAELRRRRALAARHAVAALFIGMGAFQTFDGVIDHKVLRLHQIRYGVEDLWLYDTAWILSGLVLLLVGVLLYVHARSVGLQPTRG